MATTDETSPIDDDDDRWIDHLPHVPADDAPAIPQPLPMRSAADQIRDEIARAIRISQADPDASAEILLKCVEAIAKRANQRHILKGHR